MMTTRGLASGGLGGRTGYWAKLLRDRGIPTAAFDIHPTQLTEPNGHHVMDLGDAKHSNPPPFTTGEERCFRKPVFKPFLELGFGSSSAVSESSRALPPHIPREDGLAHPADTPRTSLASVCFGGSLDPIGDVLPSESV
jgi:hypothetical protein